jgi:hypothetical protein
MQVFKAPLSAALDSLFPRSLHTSRSASAGVQSVALPSEDFDGESLMKSGSGMGEILLPLDNVEKAEFRIEGMTCGACVEVNTAFFYFVFITCVANY